MDKELLVFNYITMKSIQNKKGMTINDMYPAVLMLVMVGMVLGVGLFILSTFHDSVPTTYTGDQDDINTSTGTTTLTASTGAEYNLSALTATFINGTAITNFTFTGPGVITWGANVVDDQTKFVNTTATYTYDASDTPEEAMTTTITGLATFADWIAIIVVVIAAAIVLGIVLTSFGRKRNTI